MLHTHKNIEIYIMRHGGGWSYHYNPKYKYGEFSKGFRTKEECIKAAEKEIDKDNSEKV